MKYFRSAKLTYINLDANGVSSIIYDIVSIISALKNGNNHILLLGVSGAAILPFARLISRTRILTNIDGLEWKREKWSPLARIVLRASEWLAVRFSHEVIADNQEIANYLMESYGRPCKVIAYGGDHAMKTEPSSKPPHLPHRYALGLCRIEPENNVKMILEAFAVSKRPLVFVGNWGNSKYGKELREKFSKFTNLTLLDPVYDPSLLRAIRGKADLYVHGHSAGGTNPSLVEMMHFGIPILAHGCRFNRFSTEESADYFSSTTELVYALQKMSPARSSENGMKMSEIANRRYTWDAVAKQYFDVILDF